MVSKGGGTSLPYYTGKRYYNADGTSVILKKRKQKPGIGTWCLAIVLGFVIILVLKANGDDCHNTRLESERRRRREDDFTER